jgi:hypothetical protein
MDLGEQFPVRIGFIDKGSSGFHVYFGRKHFSAIAIANYSPYISEAGAASKNS